MEDIRELYRLSDIAVGMRSTAIVDALPYCKIIVIKDAEKLLPGNYCFYHDLDAVGELKMIDNEEELYCEVLNYIRGKHYRNKIKYYWMADNDASKSLRKYIQIFLEGKRPLAN